MTGPMRSFMRVRVLNAALESPGMQNSSEVKGCHQLQASAGRLGLCRSETIELDVVAAQAYQIYAAIDVAGRRLYSKRNSTFESAAQNVPPVPLLFVFPL